jgi:hypothetical protein
VRLVFNEPDQLARGERVQQIELQGETVKRGFDLIAETGAPMRGITLEFSGIKITNQLTLGLSSSHGKTIISGLELVWQDEPR